MPRYDAVTFDAYGTLIELDSPFERLRSAVRNQLGAGISAQDAERAFTAEIGYYVANSHRARDAQALRELRLECARIVLDELGLPNTPEEGLAVLEEALRFRTYDDVRPALEAIGERGAATAVVSNWDCSLPRILERTGLRFDVVIDSATTGAPKPDPAMFRLAAERLALDPGRILHVGDRDETDGAGARAAGMDAVIVDRSGHAAPGSLRSLTGLAAILDA
jgi:putative hydrolase of the HAD superfamily